MPRYVPEDSLESPRFTGPSTFARLPLVRDLADVDVAIVGVPFDTGVTYRVGGRFGPNAVRAASVMLRPVQHEPRRQPVRGALLRRLRRHRDRARLHRAQLRPDRAGRHADRGGGHRPAARRRRPRLHAAAPPGDPVARARSRSSTSTRTPTPGTATSGRSTTTGRGCAARSRRASSTSTTRSRSGCAARSTRRATGRGLRTELGLDYVTTEEVFALGPGGRRRPHPATGWAIGRRS